MTKKTFTTKKFEGIPIVVTMTNQSSISIQHVKETKNLSKQRRGGDENKMYFSSNACFSSTMEIILLGIFNKRVLSTYVFHLDSGDISFSCSSMYCPTTYHLRRSNQAILYVSKSRATIDAFLRPSSHQLTERYIHNSTLWSPYDLKQMNGVLETSEDMASAGVHVWDLSAIPFRSISDRREESEDNDDYYDDGTKKKTSLRKKKVTPRMKMTKKMNNTCSGMFSSED